MDLAGTRYWYHASLDAVRVPSSSPFRVSPLTIGRRHQIFAPIFLLQLVNGFWSFLLWRILWRLVLGTPITDTREEGESDDDDEEEEEEEKKKKKDQ